MARGEETEEQVGSPEGGEVAAVDDLGDEPRQQSPQTALFWADAGVDPVEIALPKGLGYTLRHYRVRGEDDTDAEEPAFLAHEGTLHLFRSPEGLVEFLRSDSPHDLRDVDGWTEIVAKVRPGDIVADEEDRYELDLVVDNLRGGYDAWDPDLVIGAGEIARDLGYALELRDVLEALQPGSPLDDLDESLRATGFLARRRRRKLGVEQVTLAWRTLVGKLSARVEWHD